MLHRTGVNKFNELWAAVLDTNYQELFPQSAATIIATFPLRQFHAFCRETKR